MVARSTDVPAFVPSDRPRVAISGDGTLAAIIESTRVVVVELPGGGPFAEVGIDPEAEACDVAWVGGPPRMFVLSRYATHSKAHLIDPHGPRMISEIRLESPMKLFAAVGAHALAIGVVGPAVMTATDTHLTPYQFPARAIPITAGAAGANFVVALAGSIEEWDPASRMPKRRLRLPRPAVITAVGGSDRVVWMMTQGEPSRIEVMPLVNRGQPKSHDLPEPIAHVAGHPRSDLLVCIGAESGKLYVVDLDGRQRLRTLGTGVIDRADAAGLVVGRMVGVLAAQAHKPIAIIALDPRETEGDTQVTQAPHGLRSAPEPESPSSRSTLFDDDEPAPSVVPPAPKAVTEPAWFRPHIPPAAARPAAPPPPPPSSSPLQNLSERFGMWRDKLLQPQASAQPQPRAEPVAAQPGTTWRDEMVTWARAVASGSSERSPPTALALDVIAARFDLAATLVPALALLYGAHLGGVHGAAPVDVARVLGRRWDEALGTGQLALRGLVRHLDSRVILAPVIQRMLDELPVATGTLVGVSGEIALLGPCVVVAQGIPLAVLAGRYLATVGSAILAAAEDTEPADLFVEARARGAVPMLRIGLGELVQVGTDPAVLVVADDAIADQLGIPRI